MKRMLVSVGIVVLILCLGLFLGRGLIIETINSVRADRLMNQAKSAFEAEDWDDATRLGTAAFHLDPDDMDNKLIIARATLKQRASGSIGWWRQVLNHPEIPTSELREVTSILINTRRLDEGLLFLNRLIELDAGDSETQRLWLDSLFVEKRLEGLMNLSERIVDEGTGEWSIHRQYLSMQRSKGGEQGSETVLNHLRDLIDANSELSLEAARELASLKFATRSDRLKAATFLEEHGIDQVDQLYAAGLQIMEGLRSTDSLQELVSEIISSKDVQVLESALAWSVWLGQPDLILDRLTWEDYLGSGGRAESYFNTLLAAEEYQRIVEISEEYFNESGKEVALYLYFRALAWGRLGEVSQAEETLNTAVQVADPGQTAQLERRLFADQRWSLLVQLYDRLLKENSNNLLFQQKYIAATYFIGEQDALQEQLELIELSQFEGAPAVQGFLLYLRVILFDESDLDHKRLEELLADYPEIFDVRLVLGLSYLLGGEASVGREFLDGMPELSIYAPRFLRVCALILGHPDQSLLPLTEVEQLLPRERYLLSRYGFNPLGE